MSAGSSSTSRSRSLSCSSIAYLSLSYANHLANLSGQRSRRKRLLEVGDPGIQNPMLKDGIVRVAGHEEHLDLTPHPRSALGKLPTAHARQHHIGETLGPRLDGTERGLAQPA